MPSDENSRVPALGKFCVRDCSDSERRQAAIGVGGFAPVSRYFSARSGVEASAQCARIAAEALQQIFESAVRQITLLALRIEVAAKR